MVIADENSADVREETSRNNVPMRSTNASMKTESTIARDPAFEIAAQATAIAYADCHTHWRDHGSRPQRNLNFCCPVSVSREDAVAITTEFVPGYNLFSPQLILALPDDCRIRLARDPQRHGRTAGLDGEG